MTRTDNELWAGVLENDQSAWNELVGRYQTLVYGVASYMGLSQADCGDCFQQTWLQLYQHRHRLRDTTRISSWLVTTTKREALRLKRLSTAAESDLESVPDHSPTPDAELELIEKQAWLEAALGDLDQPCRKVLNAFFFADREESYEAIARDLGYSPNTLGAKRFRCLKRLREILEKKGYWHERK